MWCVVCNAQALARGRDVRRHATEVRSQVAARQLEQLQGRFEGSAVIGVQCFPHTKTPDLLQL